MLINNKVSYSIIANFDLTFDDPLLNHTFTCNQGDKVEISFRNNGEILTIIGVVKTITIKPPTFRTLGAFNELVLEIDASSEFDSKVYTIQSMNIMDIKYPVVI